MPHGRTGPSAVVVVATVKALKHHGGAAKAELGEENLEALERGCPTCCAMWRISPRCSACPAWWPSTASPTDTEAELELVGGQCAQLGVNVALSEVWAKGGEGGLSWPGRCLRLCEGQPHQFQFAYELDRPYQGEKLSAIVKKVYHGDGCGPHPNAKKQSHRRAGGAGLRRTAHLHGQDPVLLLRRRQSWVRPRRFPRYGAQPEGLRRRGLRGGPHGGYHDHAWPTQGPRRGENRVISGAVLSRAWSQTAASAAHLRLAGYGLPAGMRTGPQRR